MKNQLLSFLLAAACLAPVGVARAFVYENAYELQADGDFDGDGRRDLVIVDKATGNYRLAYQVSAGNYTWVSPRASGILPVTGLAIGKLVASNLVDALAFAGADANRINILDATNSSAPGLPASVFIPSVGPNMVGAIDIGGAGNTPHDDLYVGSIYNDSGTTPHETLLRNVGTNRTVIVDNALAPAGSYRERANVVFLRTNSTPRLALYERKTTVSLDTFRVLTLSNGTPVQALSSAAVITPHPFDYVYGQFAVTNPLTQFIMWSADYSSVWAYQVAESPSGVFSLPLLGIFPFSNRVERMFTLPATNGAKLLVIYPGGTSAAVFNWDGTTNAPTLLQQFSADPGEHFTGVGVLGNSGFMAYSALLGQNTSTKFKQWNWNGSGYTAGASGSLPTLSQFSASGNVLQFQFEPFVTNAPVLLRINNAGDWSSQPVFAGSPSNITVKSESFAGQTQGLINPVAVPLGKAHPLAHFGLANQYSNMISLFSFTPPQGDKISEVTISPVPGAYPNAVTLTFTATDPTHLIYFRLSTGLPWTQFTGQKVNLYTNATVQYYGQPPASTAKSSIRSAVYTFTTGPGALDSNKDGIPDYVALATGLDPNGPSDTDKDGFSDLEELLHGTDPLNSSSYPTTNTWPAKLLHLDDQAVFDLTVTPYPWDGFSNRITLCSTGVVLSAHTLQGAFLGSALTTNPPLPFARLTNIAVDPLDRLIAAATEMHYSILTTNTNSVVGREMIGLVSVPSLQPFTVPYTYVGTNPVREATNWIVAASNAWRSLSRATLSNALTSFDSLEALLFEQAVANILGSRGNSWWTNITLFPHRVPDVGRTNPPQSTLLGIETNLDALHPGYQLKATFATISNLVETSGDPGIANLRAVTLDIYRIVSLLNNTNPATFVSPIDELRLFLWTGRLDSNYLAWSVTSNLLASASNGVMTILSSIHPRPTTNLTLVVRSDTFGLSCRILDQPGTNAPVVLQDSSGLPFSFPANFQLPAGSQVAVYGYTDGTNSSCAYPAIEVISIALAAVPIASDQDSDANLLIDSWEQKFFGHLGLDPFADSDGDGYSNLQEMLDGSDPSDRLGIPTGPPVSFAAPMLELSSVDSYVHLRFDWPAAYISKVHFHIRATTDLGGSLASFTDIGVGAPSNLGGDHWEVVTLTPIPPQQFYVVVLELAPISP